MKSVEEELWYSKSKEMVHQLNAIRRRREEEEEAGLGVESHQQLPISHSIISSCVTFATCPVSTARRTVFG